MENTVAEETAIVTQSLDLQVKAFNLGTLETNAKTILEVVKVKLAGYKAENYSGDNIAKAKADKAELNAAAKKLSDARLEYERTWMKPFEDSFKDVVAETCALIKTASAAIDQVVKDVETREKNEKRKLIETYFATLACIYFDLEKIFDPAWLNKTAKMKDIQTQITDRIKKTTGDLDILNKLGEPEAQSHSMKCPKCGGPMGNTNLQEKLCLACGYIGAPVDEPAVSLAHGDPATQLATVREKIERALIYLDADEPLSINAAKAAEILREPEALA